MWPILAEDVADVGEEGTFRGLGRSGKRGMRGRVSGGTRLWAVPRTRDFGKKGG